MLATKLNQDTSFRRPGWVSPLDLHCPGQSHEKTLGTGGPPSELEFWHCPWCWGWLQTISKQLCINQSFLLTQDHFKKKSRDRLIREDDWFMRESDHHMLGLKTSVLEALLWKPAVPCISTLGPARLYDHHFLSLKLEDGPFFTLHGGTAFRRSSWRVSPVS